MSIKNSTQKTTIHENYRLCRSAASKAKGLMFTNESTVREKALIFEFDFPRHQSIHMFFVFYPIDLMFLDGKKRVVDIKKHFKPFTIYNSKALSQFVIELPDGSIKKSKTKTGDTIKWQ
jgi:hypothetical protein